MTLPASFRDALIGFMAATAQAEAEAAKEAQRAGIAHAQAAGGRRGALAYKGRKPSYDETLLGTVRDLLAAGTGVSEVPKVTGLSRQMIYRIQADPAGASKIIET